MSEPDDDKLFGAPEVGCDLRVVRAAGQRGEQLSLAWAQTGDVWRTCHPMLSGGQERLDRRHHPVVGGLSLHGQVVDRASRSVVYRNSRARPTTSHA